MSMAEGKDDTRKVSNVWTEISGPTSVTTNMVKF